MVKSFIRLIDRSGENALIRYQRTINPQPSSEREINQQNIFGEAVADRLWEQ